MELKLNNVFTKAKYVILSLLIFTIIIGSNIVHWQLWPDDSPHYDDWWGGITTETSDIAESHIRDSGLMSELLGIFDIQTYSTQEASAASYIQTVINYFLAIVAFVALVVIIYWFYMMFFSKEQEEWFNKAKKFVINWAIALLVMWISWFVVSFIFYLVGQGI